MELRTYGAIIWRRIWVVALVVGVVLLYVSYQYYHLYKTPGALKAYQSAVTLQIGLQVSPTTTAQNNYADYITVSESLADEFTTGPILTSREFDQQVSDQISADMNQIVQRYGQNPNLGAWQNPGAIGGAVTANRYHSLVTVTVMWTTPAGAWAIAHALGEVSVAHTDVYLNYVVTNDSSKTTLSSNSPPKVSAKIISEAIDAVTVPGMEANKLTLLLVLLFVALIIGIALAFLIEYLDDRIRTNDDLKQVLQLPIYAEVPRAPSLSKATSRRSGGG